MVPVGQKPAIETTGNSKDPENDISIYRTDVSSETLRELSCAMARLDSKRRSLEGLEFRPLEQGDLIQSEPARPIRQRVTHKHCIPGTFKKKVRIG